MPAVGDIIELTSIGVGPAATPSINVFHYEVLTPGGALTPAEFINLFRIHVVQQISAITAASGWLNQGISYLNLTDGLEYATDALTDAGERTGDPLPPFVAASFILRRSTRLTRHGHKRFGALSETDVDGGLPTATYQGLCEGVATALSQGLVMGDPPPVQVARLVIVRKRSGITPLYTAVNVVSAVEFRGIGSQNSRKIAFTNA